MLVRRRRSQLRLQLGPTIRFIVVLSRLSSAESRYVLILHARYTYLIDTDEGLAAASCAFRVAPVPTTAVGGCRTGWKADAVFLADAACSARTVGVRTTILHAHAPGEISPLLTTRPRSAVVVHRTGAAHDLAIHAYGTSTCDGREQCDGDEGGESSIHRLIINTAFGRRNGSVRVATGVAGARRGYKHAQSRPCASSGRGSSSWPRTCADAVIERVGAAMLRGPMGPEIIGARGFLAGPGRLH